MDTYIQRINKARYILNREIIGQPITNILQELQAFNYTTYKLYLLLEAMYFVANPYNDELYLKIYHTYLQYRDKVLNDDDENNSNNDTSDSDSDSDSDSNSDSNSDSDSDSHSNSENQSIYEDNKIKENKQDNEQTSYTTSGTHSIDNLEIEIDMIEPDTQDKMERNELTILELNEEENKKQIE